MDSHVFRLLALELKKFMLGARVEKIHNPAPGLLSLTLYSHGLKRSLVLRHAKFYNHGLQQLVTLKGEKHPPALYLSSQRLPNPEKPSTLVMTLRKYLSGRKLGAASIDWLNRRVFFPLPQSGPIAKTPCPLWFCLDLVNGPSLVHELPSPGGEMPGDCPSNQTAATGVTPVLVPVWPDFGLLAPDHRSALEKRELWRAYPVLTPALRKTLSSLEPLEAASLLADLAHECEKNDGEAHLYEFDGVPHLLSAWPLPDELTADLTEIPLIEKTSASAHTAETAETAGSVPAFPALEAARRIYEPQILAYLGAGCRKEQTLTARAEEKRLVKALLKLDQEEQRLNDLTALRADALLLQAALWRYAPDLKKDSLAFGADETPDGRARTLKLDPLKTIRENMACLFKQADRGARGLGFIADRRKLLREELELLKSGLKIPARPKGMPADKKTAKLKARPEPEQKSNLSRLVQRFISSDGFVILRGRNAEGNQAMLRLAQPHDIWLHAEGGPSAHVIIRRENLAQDIPQRTLLEAGTLCALKSWRKNDSKAEIISALVKDVRPIKGGAMGSVRVDKQLAGFVVAPAPELEEKLAAQTRRENS